MPLEHLLAALEREAEGTAARWRTEAREEAARIAAEAAAERERRYGGLLAAREAELRGALERELYAARRDSRRDVLAARERFLERVLERVRDRLRATEPGPELAARLPALVAAVRAYLPETEEAFLHVPPLLAAAARELVQDGNRLQVVPDAGVGHGAILETAGGGLRIVHTLEAHLERLAPRLRVAALAQLAAGPGAAPAESPWRQG